MINGKFIRGTWQSQTYICLIIKFQKYEAKLRQLRGEIDKII